jgi:hypothetical protein
MISRLYFLVYQRRLPVEIRFGADRTEAERMLRHLEILVAYPPEAVETKADEIIRKLAKSSHLSAASRLTAVLLVLLGFLVSGIGFLSLSILVLLAAMVLVGVSVLYAYSKIEERRDAGSYPEYYYESRLRGWLRDAAKIVLTRSPEEGVAAGRAIVGGLIYDYIVERRRGRVYMRLKPV